MNIEKQVKINYTDSSLRTLAMETLDKNIMVELSSCDHWGVRWNLTKNNNVSLDILETLEDDICPHVLMGLLSNNKINEDKAIDIYLSNKERLTKFKKKIIEDCIDPKKKEVKSNRAAFLEMLRK